MTDEIFGYVLGIAILFFFTWLIRLLEEDLIKYMNRVGDDIITKIDELSSRVERLQSDVDQINSRLDSN